jgi:T-lymphoma invasion and metastasis-inducing protein 1
LFQLVSVFLRDAMTVEEFLASACTRKNLNPMEHFVRVKKRRDMEDHNYFVPHRTDLIETYVSLVNLSLLNLKIKNRDK